MRSALFLACLAILAGCSPSGGAPGETDDTDDTDETGDVAACPLDAVARTYVEAVLRSEVANTSWTLEWAGPMEMAWGIVLPGSEIGNIAVASLMFACEEPTTFDAYCGEADQGLFACGRLGCEEPGVHRAEVWLADAAHQEDHTPHALSWPTTQPTGTAYAPVNPGITWYADVNADPHVWADADHDVEVTTDGTTWDGSYTGTLDATHSDPPVLDIALSFPGIAEDGPVTLAVDAVGDDLAGTIAAGDEILATVTMTMSNGEGDLTVDWSEDCR